MVGIMFGIRTEGFGEMTLLVFMILYLGQDFRTLVVKELIFGEHTSLLVIFNSS